MSDLDSRLATAVTSPISGHVQLELNQTESQFAVSFPDGHIFGEVNAQLEKALTNIEEQHHQLEFEVFAPIRAARETIGRAAKEQEAVIRVQVNVYGSPASAESVGQELSQNKVYLQRPDYIRDGATYENPHMLKLADDPSTEPIQPVAVEEQSVRADAAADAFQQTITNVYSSLTRDKHLKGLEGHERLRTSLLE